MCTQNRYTTVDVRIKSSPYANGSQYTALAVAQKEVLAGLALSCAYLHVQFVH